MTQAYWLFETDIELPRQLIPVADQGIAIQIILALFFAAMKKLGCSFILVLAGVTIDRKWDEIRAGITQLLG